MVHVVIVTHDAADVDCRRANIIVKLSIRLCLQLILNILLMLARRREHSKLISLTLTKIGMVTKFVL